MIYVWTVVAFNHVQNRVFLIMPFIEDVHNPSFTIMRINDYTCEI